MSYGNYPDLSVVKKILIVKLRHHGDVLLTSPLFTLLKQKIPAADIDAFVYKDTLPMLEGHAAITDFLLYDRAWKKLSFLQKLRKELALLWQVRKNKYDLVINLTEGDRGAIAAFVSGSCYRVGFDPQGKGFLGKSSLYTHVVKACASPRHTVERQLDVLRRIGIFPGVEERELSLHVPEEAFAILEKKGLEAQRYVVIHPVSRWRFKCPPMSLIAELIRQLHKRGEKIVLSAGPDSHELEMIAEIKTHLGDTPVVDLAGAMTLKELAALVKMSKCVICVDSVPLHIASALKTPVVVLFGPSSEKNWGPWQHPQSRVVAQQRACRPCHLDGCGGSKMSDCLYTLSARDILQAFDELFP